MNETIKLKGIWKIKIHDFKTGKLKREYLFENLIPTCGRAMIANNLSNASPTNLMLVKYFALGSGTVAPANANTTLGTEVYRNSIASRTNGSNVAYFTGFVNATETSGTFYEAGIFSDGSITANSGILLSRVLLNAPTGISKSNTETLTIDYELTIN